MMEMFIALLIGYLLLRLVFLTKLPIFNDEAIYLDWGWRSLFTAHNPFYALYDAKPPLVLWLFGISQMFFSSPLFAGRVVSVAFGVGTLLGIVLIGTRVFGKRVGMLAGILYTVIPLFTFFDRQALLESALCFVQVWMLYCCVRFLERLQLRWVASIGVIAAVGLYIKTSSGISLILAGAILSWVCLKRNDPRRWVIMMVIISSVIFVLLLPMAVQPQYWISLSSDSRYVLSIGELAHLPVLLWIRNITTTLEIMLIQLTPGVLIVALVGIVSVWKLRRRTTLVLLFWFVANLIFTILVYRSLIERYLVPVLPEVALLAAVGMQSLIHKFPRASIVIVVGSLGIPLLMTLVQVINPTQYLLGLGKTHLSGLQEYIAGVTSGYGITETVDYLEHEVGTEQAMVGFAINTGNPESALTVYFHRNPNIQAGYFDARAISGDLANYDCVRTSFPVYFISRENQRAGLERFLVLQKVIHNPYGQNSIGIYKLQSSCVGRTFNLYIQQK